MAESPLSANELNDQLRKLTQIGILLSHERDLSRLLDKILYESRRFTRAEAGTLYVKENPDQWKLEEELRLRPDRDGFDGFYAARLVRLESAKAPEPAE